MWIRFILFSCFLCGFLVFWLRKYLSGVVKEILSLHLLNLDIQIPSQFNLRSTTEQILLQFVLVTKAGLYSVVYPLFLELG